MTRTSPPAPFRALNLGFWLVVGLWAFGIRLAMGEPAAQAAGFVIVVEGSCLLLSLGLRKIYRRRHGAFGLGTAALLIAASLGAALLQTSIATGFALWTGWHNTMQDFFVTAVLRNMSMWAVFMIWSLGYFWLCSEAGRVAGEARRELAEREARHMELQMLRAQLDPHFLFNSLNGIAAEIPAHSDAALEMVNDLSEYLRYSLDHRKEPFVQLATEARAMEAYLRIQRARFGERLRFTVAVENSAGWRMVPCFLLQPLVENALKHGLEKTGGDHALLEISLEAKTSAEALSIRVSNTGALRPADPNRTGFGLETLRRRLDLHYPGRHSFQLREDHGRVVAELELKGTPCSA